MSKGLSSAYRIGKCQSFSKASERRFRGWLTLLILICVLIQISPAHGLIDYYSPNAEDIDAGTKESGSFPKGIEERYSLAIRYREQSLNLDVKYEWDDAPMTRLILDMRSKVTDNGICSGEYVTVMAYNSSSSDWDSLFNVNTSTYANDSVELTYYQWNNSKPTIRFEGQDPLLCIQDSLNFTIDYIALYDYYTWKIDDLQDRIIELEKENQRLRKELEGVTPDVVVNQTNLPTIPHTSRGNLDDDVQFVDPYRTTTYTVNAAPSAGSSVALYLPYPTTADEVTCIQDDLWIGGTYTRLHINTTGAVSLLDTTSTYTYFGDLDCQNVTVETIGGNVIANRIVDVRLIDSFDWGYNTDTGIFSHRSRTQNDIAYNMENVRIYWAFPSEDSDNRDVFVDMSSVVVKDADNNLVLDRGRHYEVNEGGGVSLEVRWVNTSGTTESRTFHIQFTRDTFVESESFYTVTDTEIGVSDVYDNAPYTVNVHHTQQGTASFSGKVIVKFKLTGKYAGEKLDVNTLRIRRSDTSGFQEYTYDSISNEVRITDQTIDAGDTVTYTFYFDWLTERGAILGLLIQFPLLIVSAICLTGFMAIVWISEKDTKRPWKRWVGYGALIFDVVALMILLAFV